MRCSRSISVTINNMKRKVLIVATFLCLLPDVVFSLMWAYDNHGQSVPLNNYGHQLSLQHQGNHVCSATMISPTVALTSAHCIQGRNMDSLALLPPYAYANGLVPQYGARPGFLNGPINYEPYGAGKYAPYRNFQGNQAPEIISITSHPQYDADGRDYNYATIQLNSPFGPEVKVMVLANENDEIEVGSEGFVLAWNMMEGALELIWDLMGFNVQVLDVQMCAWSNDGITERMICVGGDDEEEEQVCLGDYGSPLIYQGAQYGIMSNYQQGKPCIYAKISPIRDWIDTMLDE